MAAAAAHDGTYRLGTLEVAVHDGVATVAGTDTIAGSTLTQDVALRLALDDLRLPRSEAVAALTATPARILGLGDRFGLLAPGYAADVVVLDAGDAVEQVWAGGVAS
jgi:N-acetylglucosamine-6-phosphate deacetylase